LRFHIRTTVILQGLIGFPKWFSILIENVVSNLKDAWGALSEYLKKHDHFPKVFRDWFSSIFEIYQIRDEFGERIAPFETLLRLYLFSAKDNRDALDAYNQITCVNINKFFFNKNK
jgi:hypothetical protein